MEKHSGNTLSYRQLQKICAKNKPRGVKCAGRGVTKAYLHEKLSALGLLDGPEAPASDASRAPNTKEYLLSLSQDVREKIIKTYPALAGGGVASASKKQAMTEVAEAFADTPAWKITEYCTKIKDLCEDSFYEALFHDVYPDIHKMLSKVPVSIEMKSFHDEYRPESIDKKEESEGSEDEESEKRHYHFWEQLYVEIDALTANKKNTRLLEDVLNEGRVVSEDSTIFKASPFLSVYLANALPFFVEDVIVKNDMELYRYLDVPLTEMEIMLDSGKPNIISIVLSDGRVDPSTYNNQAIRSASQFGHLEVVKLLLADSRVDPTADNNFAIRTAAFEGHLEVVKLLLADLRVDPRVDENEVICNASLFGYAEVVKLLLADVRVDPTARNNAAIRLASGFGHANVVKLLLTDSRVDPSADNNQAIRNAAFKGHADVVKLLLTDSRVDPTADNNEAIRKASYEGHAEVVKLLLADPRVDPTAYNNYAIREASLNGHAEVVRLLLADSRVDPRVAENEVIHKASLFGHLEVVKLLLADERVDPGADNNLAIRNASWMGHVEVVKLLLADSRVDPSANSAYYSADNNQAIRNASQFGHAEVVRLLLADGRADPAANYNEAIRNASKYGYVEIVELLLADGRADPTVKDHDAILATLIRERSEMKAQISTKRAEIHKSSTSEKEQRRLEKEVAETLIARNKLNSRISLHRNKIKESFRK